VTPELNRATNSTGGWFVQLIDLAGSLADNAEELSSVLDNFLLRRL
jgi:hypothetical protein